MPLRVPPGKAGRVWLVRRLDTARRGAELLDRKRAVLLREQAVARAELAAARRAWEAAAADARTWGARSAILDGAGRLELLAAHVDAEAQLELSWSNLMGAQIPHVERVAVPAAPEIAALGGSAATVMAARAHAEAVRAGARCAVAERHAAELSAELARAARRLRALQQRWIPQHEQALAALDLALDESNREQAVRVRWALRAASRRRTADPDDIALRQA